MSAPRHASQSLVIPLDTHEAKVAALVLCNMIGNDNRAVVMARGLGEDWDNFSGLYLDDYELDELIEDPDWIGDYEDMQVWVTIPSDSA